MPRYRRGDRSHSLLLVVPAGTGCGLRPVVENVARPGPGTLGDLSLKPELLPSALGKPPQEACVRPAHKTPSIFRMFH